MNDRIIKLIDYLGFKLDCLREQESNPLLIDRDKTKENLDTLRTLATEKEEALKLVMPRVPIYTKRAKPKDMHKKDGTLSSHGEKWFALLKKEGLPEDTEGPVSELTDWKEPNPNSTPQVKKWLDSMGWEPETFKFTRNKETGEEKSIPQVRKDGELCPSVVRLDNPDLAPLEGLTILQHRIGILEAFLTHSDECGRVVASAGGFTNTLRLQHRVPIVNLPGVDKPYGKEIRECIVAGENELLCGSDVSSLEDKTKRHYMFPHDPDYVMEMEKDGFDPHLDLAKFAGAVTPEEVEKHSLKQVDLSPIRKQYKAANYSCIYGVGAQKLARELSINVRSAAKLIKAYWERNWSVKTIAEQAHVKTLKDGTMWLYNPLSKFYYNLRYDKDRWSTLNQSSGVYVFDCWVLFARKEGLVVNMQYHDEVLIRLHKDNKHTVKDRLEFAMDQVNKMLKLNVTIGIESKFGSNYAEVH